MRKVHLIALVVVTVGVFALAGCEACGVPGPAEPAAPAPAPAPKSCGEPGEVSSAMALPTGDKATSAVWVEKTGPAYFAVGQEVTYKIIVTNLTKLTLLDVEVTEALPEGFKVKYATPKATLSGNDLKWRLDSLAPHASETMSVTGTSDKAGTLKGCTTVTYRPPAVCLAMKAVNQSLKVAKSGPDTVSLCDPIAYKVVVTNTGDIIACNVVLKDALPEGLMTVDGKQSVALALGNMEPGASKEVSLQVKASKTGTFSNQSSAAADGGITAQSNAVKTTVVQPVLSITKQGPEMRYIERPVQYTITVKNVSDTPARDVVLTDTLSAGTVFHSATEGGQLQGNKVVWRLGSLAAKAEKTVAVTVSGNVAGTISDTATVQAYCAEPKTAQSKTEIKGIPAILLEAVDLVDPVEVGAETTYVVTVTNQGSAEGTNIVIKATLPPEEQLVEATGATQSSTKGQEITFAPLPRLDPKARAVYRIKVKGVKAGDVRFKVELTSDQMTSPATETESTHIY